MDLRLTTAVALTHSVGMTGVVATYLLEGLMATWLVLRSIGRMG